jgi:hypothetical protein
MRRIAWLHAIFDLRPARRTAIARATLRPARDMSRFVDVTFLTTNIDFAPSASDPQKNWNGLSDFYRHILSKWRDFRVKHHFRPEPCCYVSHQRDPTGRRAMYDNIPDYLLREQNTVGALFAFLAVRFAMLSFGLSHAMRRSSINAIYLGLVGLFVLPQLADVFADGTLAQMAWPVLEGKLIGCTLAYFGASALHRNIGYQK